MDFIVRKSDLLKSLNHIQSIVEKKHILPILANVKLEGSDGVLKLTTTDMDISITDSIATKLLKNGSTTIPVLLLYDIIKKIPEEVDMHFFIPDENTNHITIRYATSTFNLPCIPAEEFPNFELREAMNSFLISSAALKELFSKTKHAISTEEARYYLGGVYIHNIEENNHTIIKAVALDGHRLAKAEYQLSERIPSIGGIIVPHKTINQVLKLLENNVGDTKVSLSNKSITFEIGASRVISKLIDGKFPDYNRLIPTNNDKTLQTSCKALSNSIELVTAVSSDKTKTIKFHITPTEISLSASGEFNGSASGSQTIPSTYDSDPISISFNAKYLLDALDALKSEEVKLMIYNPGSAITILDGANDKNLCILMPLQV